MNSPSKIVRWSAVAVSAVWAAVLYLTGLDLDDDVRRFLAYLPSALGLLVVAFDLWLWKMPGVRRISGRPRLYGTWRAVITPSAQSLIPSDGNQGPIRAAIVVEQTFWTLSVRLHTDQSSSSSSTAAIVTSPDSKHSKSLIFTYQNRPRQEHINRSPVHNGTTLLNVVGAEPEHLDGTYWTDRLTSGDLTLQLVNRQSDTSRVEALKLAKKRTRATQGR